MMFSNGASLFSLVIHGQILSTGFHASLTLLLFSCFISLHVAGMAKAELRAIKLRRNCIRSLVP